MGNRLYYGDNLDILREHIPDESVDLIYLDPPFNSKRDYNLLFKTPKGHESDAQITAFEDSWHWGAQAEREFHEIVRGGNTDVAELMQALRKFLGENDMMAYLTMMANRLVEMHRVLKQTGSLYLHCDPTASHYLKLVLDGVFGPERFLNEIIWKRTSAHSSAKRWGDVHDTLLFYSRSAEYTWNQLYQAHDEGHVASKYSNEDKYGRYMPADLTGAGRRGGDSGAAWRDFNPDSLGRHWAIPKRVPEGRADLQGWEKLTTQEKLERLDKAGFIYWPEKTGGFPRFKKYLGEGVPIQTVVTDIPPINSQADERLGYPTQKPLALLERIMQASSREGDVVLDPFCGCGTAVHAAHKLGRQWIGIDITHLAVALVARRLRAAFPYLEAASPGTKKAAQAGPNMFEIVGVPRDLDAARELAKRDPHQFQLWACTLVGAQPFKGGKRGSDKGVDGLIFPDVGGKTEKIVVSVKGGENIGVAMVRDLKGTIEREKAAIGLFVTLTTPTRDMTKEAAAAGFYEPPRKFGARAFPKIQVLTIEGLLSGAERAEYPDIAYGTETFKTAKVEKKREDQGALF